VLDQPADVGQASQRPPGADEVAVDVDAVAGDDLAVAKDHQILTGISARRAIDLAIRLPKRSWQRLSAGRGSKRERWYDWVLVETTDPASEPASDPAADPDATSSGHHWLLIRRNRTTGEYAFYRAYSPAPVPLAALVKVAGRRWTI
jgi:hypothetical protein